MPVYGGIGTFGLRGPGLEVEDVSLTDLTPDHRFRPGVIHNLGADPVIATKRGRMGAHSDICRPELARAGWRAAGR